MAWRRLEALTEPGAAVLLDVFMSWMVERYKGRTYEEILKMLHVLTPLEETRAYQQLVGIGIEKGKQEGREEGREKGREEGREEMRAALLARLMAAGMSEAQARTMLDL